MPLMPCSAACPRPGSALESPTMNREAPGEFHEIKALSQWGLTAESIYTDARITVWRDLPERFGDFRVVHLRFSRWAKTGVWARVFEHLAQDADNEYAMIDATIVRAHQHSAGAQKKTATTKRSAAAKAD